MTEGGDWSRARWKPFQRFDRGVTGGQTRGQGGFNGALQLFLSVVSNATLSENIVRVVSEREKPIPAVVSNWLKSTLREMFVSADKSHYFTGPSAHLVSPALITRCRSGPLHSHKLTPALPILRNDAQPVAWLSPIVCIADSLTPGDDLKEINMAACQPILTPAYSCLK